MSTCDTKITLETFIFCSLPFFREFVHFFLYFSCWFIDGPYFWLIVIAKRFLKEKRNSFLSNLKWLNRKNLWWKCAKKKDAHFFLVDDGDGGVCVIFSSAIQMNIVDNAFKRKISNYEDCFALCICFFFSFSFSFNNLSVIFFNARHIFLGMAS